MTIEDVFSGRTPEYSRDRAAADARVLRQELGKTLIIISRHTDREGFAELTDYILPQEYQDVDRYWLYDRARKADEDQPETAAQAWMRLRPPLDAPDEDWVAVLMTVIMVYAREGGEFSSNDFLALIPSRRSPALIGMALQKLRGQLVTAGHAVSMIPSRKSSLVRTYRLR